MSVLINPYVFAAGYKAVAADFDGSNDYLTRASLNSVVDGRQGMLSVWLRPDALSSRYFVSSNSSIGFRTNSNGSLAANFRNSASTLGADFTTAAGAITVSQWNHILISWDMNYSSGNKICQFYANDVDVTPGSYTDFGGAFNIDYTIAWGIGAANNGDVKLDGCMSEFYFNTVAHLDLDVEANRRKFITAGGKPADLGSVDGSTPTGVQPAIYLKNEYSTFQNNLGFAGDFTVNGALAACASSPSD